MLVLFFSVLITTWLSILNGWALSVLWSWFMVPTFNAPELTVPAAIGIAMIVGFLTYQLPESSDTRTREEKIQALLVLFMRPIFAIIVGFIVKLFM